MASCALGVRPRQRVSTAGTATAQQEVMSARASERTASSDVQVRVESGQTASFVARPRQALSAALRALSESNFVRYLRSWHPGLASVGAMRGAVEPRVMMLPPAYAVAAAFAPPTAGGGALNGPATDVGRSFPNWEGNLGPAPRINWWIIAGVIVGIAGLALTVGGACCGNPALIGAGVALTVVGAGLLAYGVYRTRCPDPGTAVLQHLFEGAPPAVAVLAFDSLSTQEQRTLYEVLQQPVPGDPSLARIVRAARQSALATLWYRMAAISEAGDMREQARFQENIQAERAAGVDHENVMNTHRIRSCDLAIEALAGLVTRSQRSYQEVLGDVRRYVRTHASVALADKALRTLDAPRRRQDYSEPLCSQTREGELCVLLWEAIEGFESMSGDTTETSSAQDAMRYSLLCSLADCIEADGHRVCGVGIRQRLIGVARGYYKLPPELPLPGQVLTDLARNHSQLLNGATPTAEHLNDLRTSAQRTAREVYADAPGLLEEFVKQLEEYLAIDVRDS